MKVCSLIPTFLTGSHGGCHFNKLSEPFRGLMPVALVRKHEYSFEGTSAPFTSDIDTGYQTGKRCSVPYLPNLTDQETSRERKLYAE